MRTPPGSGYNKTDDEMPGSYSDTYDPTMQYSGM